MTTDIAIDRVLKGEPKFKGVYLYDQIDNIHQLGDEAIIINYVTSDEVQQGISGHFVVLDNRDNILKGDKRWNGLYYFDPYGLKVDIGRDIMRLDNTHNIERLIQRTVKAGAWQYNTTDFQAWMPKDDLCGVYSTEYVINPDFSTNPLFGSGRDRVNIDHKMLKLFGSLNFVNSHGEQPLKQTFDVLSKIADGDLFSKKLI